MSTENIKCICKIPTFRGLYFVVFNFHLTFLGLYFVLSNFHPTLCGLYFVVLNFHPIYFLACILCSQISTSRIYRSACILQPNHSTSCVWFNCNLWISMSQLLFFQSAFPARVASSGRHRPGKSVQYSSDPEFAFSNVPQKCVKRTRKFGHALRVRYPRRIIFQLRSILKVWNSIMFVGTSVRKQNNLQILLTGYEKHFTISNDK